ncbi:MAG: phenylalanine--tRNA ligase subunit alpha [Spirochaetia bacterium]
MLDLDSIWKNFKEKLSDCQSQAEIFNLKAMLLGKEGTLSRVLKDIKNLSVQERAEIGQKANELKQHITASLEAQLALIERVVVEKTLSKNAVDVSDLHSGRELGLVRGSSHPLTLIEREVQDLFFSMGFDILDGNFIEDEYHNFSALNIPALHPSRDAQDTFWFKNKVNCLRTQTSPVQIRGMEQYRPPFKFVSLGKVFRNENIDASHEMAFHQIEAMVVDRDINVGHMMHFLQSLISKTLKKEVKVRLRTGYFPFVEPGFELDIQCQICTGVGCPVCKHNGWIEFCGCGLVHPQVLKEGSIDSQQWSGFAFGIGWDRLAMMRYGINDIRYMHGADLRFLSQFTGY